MTKPAWNGLVYNFDRPTAEAPNNPDKFGGTQEEYQARIDASAASAAAMPYGHVQALAAMRRVHHAAPA